MGKEKIIAIILSAMLLATGYGFSGAEVYAQGSDEYIVIANDDKTAESIENSYSLDSNETAEGTDRVLTGNLTDVQANRLDKRDDIVCIERDAEIIGDTEYIEAKIEGKEDNWPEDMVAAENAKSHGAGIRIAVIDSGVDGNSNFEIEDRIDFQSDEQKYYNNSYLFDDMCGHGTAVASIIAGRGENGNVEGIAQNAQIYSVKVLDEDRKATMGKIVRAIYWAIDNDMDIINMSFGTGTYSKALEQAVNDAYAKGILIVAATGNDANAGVDYPAAFENVLSVGSVNAKGQVSDFSPRGDSVDVMAPGEGIMAQSNFGIEMQLSGSSLAAPYVSAIAAALWSKDTSKPAEFIKDLIIKSSKTIEEGGYTDRLVDYEYALKLYDDVYAQYCAKDLETDESQPENTEQTSSTASEESETSINEQETGEEAISEEETESDAEPVDIGEDEQSNNDEITPENIEIEENTQEVEDLSANQVTGSWSQNNHQIGFDEYNYIKKGAIVSDIHFKKYDDKKPAQEQPMQGMTKHPTFHGYSGKTFGKGGANYIAAYRYLSLVARAYRYGKNYSSVKLEDCDGLSAECYRDMRAALAKIDKGEINGEFPKWGDKFQAAYITGIAAHTAADTFAHSAYRREYVSGSGYVKIRLTHNKIYRYNCDNPKYYPKRWEMEQGVMKNVIDRWDHLRDYKKYSKGYGNDFFTPMMKNTSNYANLRINKMGSFARAANVKNETSLKYFDKLSGY